MLSSRADAVDDQTQSRAVVLLSFIKHGNFTKEANLQGKAPSKKIMEVLEASTDSELMPVAKDTEAEKSLLGTFSENEPRAWDVRLRKLRQYQLQTPRISTQTAMKWVAEAALDPKAERAVEIVEHGLAYLYTVGQLNKDPPLLDHFGTFAESLPPNLGHKTLGSLVHKTLVLMRVECFCK